jgi:hypothetical protein
MRKYAGLTIGLLVTLAVVGGLVYAVPGADFEWISTGPGGVRVGEPGTEGEGIAPDTIEFANPGSGIVFADNGYVGNGDKNELLALSDTKAIVAAMDEGGEVTSALMVSNESITEGEETNCTAALMSFTGNVVVGAGHLVEEGEGDPVFVPHAGVVCSHTGDVVVQLGSVAPGGEGEGGESMMAGGGSGGDSLMQEITESATISDALAQDVADTVSATNAWTTGFRLRLPTHRFTQ